MEIAELFQKKIKRKKFFTTAGTGMVGYFVFRSFPFNLFTRKEAKKTQKIKIRINPLAVERKNTGKTNV
ncbi:MAG: hypothetical protein P8Z35_26955 [Ignavibacteriaceae bacterium]|jgi:hypothetical protein